MSAIVISALCIKPLNLEQLKEHVILFNSLLAKYGTPCLTQGNQYFYVLMYYEFTTSIDYHINLSVGVGDDVAQFVRDCLDVHKIAIRPIEQGYFCCKSVVSEAADLQAKAAARLVLQQYTNQLLGPLINVAVFSVIRAKGVTESSNDT